MELTKNQLQEIENYIKSNDVDYIDLKIELLDHITSDVEHKISKGFSFESAFQFTKQKWNKHFRNTSSIFLGFQHSTSKIVLKKAVKEFKPFYFLYIFSYFFPFLIIKTFSIEYTENMMFYINTFFKIATLLALIYFVFIIYKVSFSKVKTTYRFILKTQYFGIVFLLTAQFFTGYSEKLGQMNEFFVSFSCVGLATTYICHHFYKKHFLEISKNNKTKVL
ncbi:hypothetical protein [Polaribacter uvawellassae]|uniref:hypothetical protein n=1 Tax=Polaribacter uvawellassae TaxID=3133495 RepID=UPI00321AF29C